MKTHVIEGRADVRDVACSLKLIIEKGYIPSSASDLVRVVFAIISNEAKKEIDVGDIHDSSEAALAFIKKHGLSQKSKSKRAEASLLKQLQIEDLIFEEADIQEDRVDKALRELKGE